LTGKERVLDFLIKGQSRRKFNRRDLGPNIKDEEEEVGRGSRVAILMQFHDSRRIIRRVTPLYEIPVLPPPPAVRVPAHPPMLLSLRLFFRCSFLPTASWAAPEPKSKRIITEQSSSSRPINDLFRDRTFGGNRLHSRIK